MILFQNWGASPAKSNHWRKARGLQKPGLSVGVGWVWVPRSHLFRGHAVYFMMRPGIIQEESFIRFKVIHGNVKSQTWLESNRNQNWTMLCNVLTMKQVLMIEWYRNELLSLLGLCAIFRTESYWTLWVFKRMSNQTS